MNENNNKKNNKFPGNLIILGIFLLITMPEIIVPVLIVAGIGFAVYYFRMYHIHNRAKERRQQMTSGRQMTYGRQITSGREMSARREKFDDCPQPLFCFHKDKGEHHVRKGREIDPWDRPDIDISKYQRK